MHCTVIGPNLHTSKIVTAISKRAAAHRDGGLLFLRHERYHEEMELAALRILPEQKDAEDAMQNAFVQVIRHFWKVSEIPCEELPFWLICIIPLCREAIPSTPLIRRARSCLPIAVSASVRRAGRCSRPIPISMTPRTGMATI